MENVTLTTKERQMCRALLNTNTETDRYGDAVCWAREVDWPSSNGRTRILHKLHEKHVVDLAWNRRTRKDREPFQPLWRDVVEEGWEVGFNADTLRALIGGK